MYSALRLLELTVQRVKQAWGPEENGTIPCSLPRPVRRGIRAPRVLAARKPMLLLLLFGLLLFRFAHRRLLSLLFHEPPRSTRLRWMFSPEPRRSLTGPSPEPL